MDAESIYLDWAVDSIWSRWVKPVLFAHLSDAVIARALRDTPHEPVPADVGGVPRATGATAILVDLPGAASIATGLALAELGYRPVPLYNSVPVMLPDLSMPSPAPAVDPAAGLTQEYLDLLVSLNLPAETSERGPRAAIDMYPIVRLLVQATQGAPLKTLSPQAPPAFLLDSRRRGIGAMLRPGDFDNRSISLPTDFPSANFLLANWIRDAIVIQEQEGPPQQDLAHTLRRWQDAGIEIMTSIPGATPQPVVVGPPPRFRHMWYGLLARLGLRQNPLGGYGGFLPVPSAG
jgi:hypothetical protein